MAVDEVKRHNVNLCLYFMIFYNINRVCNNYQLISISDLPSSKKEIDNLERSNIETTHLGNARFWSYKTKTIIFINVLKHIVHLYCTCFILGPLRQDFIKIFRYCFFFPLFSHIPRVVAIRSKPTVGIA